MIYNPSECKRYPAFHLPINGFIIQTSYNFWIWKAPKLSDLQDIIVAHKGDKTPVAVGPYWSLSFGGGLFMVDMEFIKVRILTCQGMIDSHLSISARRFSIGQGTVVLKEVCIILGDYLSEPTT